ncbi:MAG: thioredoxin, partial [Deltaproteobacteria bacterium]|nr:thioredoxin [Deltaproteobacteria bacterium]
RKPVPAKPKPPAPTTLDYNEPEAAEPAPATSAPPM